MSSLLCDSCLANVMSRLLPCSEIYHPQASLAEPVKRVCWDQGPWSQGQPCQCFFELFCTAVALFVSQRGVVGKEWQTVDTPKLLVHSLSIQFSHMNESELRINPQILTSPIYKRTTNPGTNQGSGVERRRHGTTDGAEQAPGPHSAAGTALFACQEA